MRKFLTGYFCFTRGERNGTFALATIMVLVFVFPYIYNAIRGQRIYRADPEFLKEIEAFYGLSGDDTINPANRQAQDPVPVVPGGPEAGKNPFQNANPADFIRPVIMKTDLNSADTAGLMLIKGIGPVLSRRILRYRDILGGYCDLSQLLEVYGMDNERYGAILPFLSADTSLVVKLHPASDEFGVLLRHPYLDYDQVAEIFRLRNGPGPLSPAGLLESAYFSGSDIERLLPYLAFD